MLTYLKNVFSRYSGEKMRIEKQLIKKMYYETFLMENVTKPPLDVLGEAYVNEEKMRFLMDLIFVLRKVNFIISIKILKQLFLNGRRLVMN